MNIPLKKNALLVTHSIVISQLYDATIDTVTSYTPNEVLALIDDFIDAEFMACEREIVESRDARITESFEYLGDWSTGYLVQCIVNNPSSEIARVFLAWAGLKLESEKRIAA